MSLSLSLARSCGSTLLRSITTFIVLQHTDRNPSVFWPEHYNIETESDIFSSTSKWHLWTRILVKLNFRLLTKISVGLNTKTTFVHTFHSETRTTTVPHTVNPKLHPLTQKPKQCPDNLSTLRIITYKHTWEGLTFTWKHCADELATEDMFRSRWGDKKKIIKSFREKVMMKSTAATAKCYWF